VPVPPAPLATPERTPTNGHHGNRHRETPSGTALAKRHAALIELGRFRRLLEQSTSQPDVERLVTRTRDRLLRIQGRRADRPYLSKSLSQIATAVRRRGWPAAALELLRWAIANDAADRYILTDVIQCELALGDLPGALETLAIARKQCWATDGMYAAVISATAKAGALTRARDLFDQALADGMAKSFCFTSLINAYGKAGHLDVARTLLARAHAFGYASSASYTAVIDACGKLGDLVGAREQFDAARMHGLAGPPTYTALIDAFGRAGDIESAQRCFDEARASGRLSDFSYAALLDAYAKAGHLRCAERLFDEARVKGYMSAHCYTIMISAHRRAKRHRAARKLWDEAIAEGRWDDRSTPSARRGAGAATSAAASRRY
jgi:pentatricopeptide repeat protein